MTSGKGTRGDSVLLVGTMTSPSGAPLAMLRLAEGLRLQGRKVEACFLYHREDIEGGDHGYDTLLPAPPSGAGDYLRLMVRLWARLRKEPRAAVITFLPLASVLSGFLARFAGVPRRIVSHRVRADSYTGAMRRLDAMMARFGFYTDVAAVSQSVADSCAYPERLRSRTHVIYNGLKDWRGSDLSRAEARRRFGIAEQACLLVAVGRLDAQKNYPMLLAAMKDTPDGVMLAIAGSGDDREAIEAQIDRDGLSDKVCLLGSIARGDVPHLLAAADLFVQPSLFEGQSNALLEALHAGLPCFVSDAPEQVETVVTAGGAVAGAVLPVADSAAWAAAIREFAAGECRDPALAGVIAERAGCFTYERMMAGYARLLDRSDSKSDS